MKKLLAILGATSLSVIAGASVISCVKYQESKPRFRNLTSIDTNSWTLKTKKFTSQEINPDDNTSIKLIEPTSYLYYSILNDFKNPEDVINYFTTRDIKYQVVAPPTKIKDKDDKELYSLAVIRLIAFNKGSTDVLLTTTNLSVKIYPTTTTRLAASETAAITTTLTVNDGSLKIANAITSFASDYFKRGYSELPDQFINDLMYNLDLTIKNLLIEKLEQTYLPTYNETDKIFYETLGQQLKYLNEKYTVLNDTIIKKIKTYSLNNILQTNIQKDFPTITLGNFTITLDYSN